MKTHFFRKPVFSALLGLLAALSFAGCESSPMPTPQPPPPGPPPPPPPPPADHAVSIPKEMLINATAVVDGTRATRVQGPWHVHTLMQRLSGESDPSAFTLAWLRLWMTDQTIGSFKADARPDMDDIITAWKQASNQAGTPDAQTRLNWSKAPFRLLAIVNRMDLAPPEGVTPFNAGEGRFVFCLTNPDGSPKQFTVIFEYKLNASNRSAQIAWAKRWHSLGRHSAFNAAYLTELEAITNTFTGTGGELGQIRTNELEVGSPWELREFNLSGGRLISATVKQHPDKSLNNTQQLADFINANAASIPNLQHTVPNDMLGVSALNEFQESAWKAPGLEASLRRDFSQQTCNGCHGVETLNDGGSEFFTHIRPRSAGSPASLSSFLTGGGGPVPDPVGNGPARRFNDLAARVEIMNNFLGESSLETMNARMVHKARWRSVH